MPNIEPIFIVVQQGGSSFEWYASSYDNREAADSAILGHKQASYNSIGPYAVSQPLDEGNILALIESACRDAATQTYSEVHNVETEGSVEAEAG